MALGMIDAQQIGGYRDLLFGGPATSNAKNVERSGDMSYPPPRYNGTTGETSAIFRSGVHGPELVYPSGGTVHYLATGASTAGEFGLYRWDFAASASGPDPHFHRSISESFFILSGTVRLYDGNRWIDATPGDYLFVPEGGVHAFRNESGERASMLLLFAPGAPREEYFETLADAVRDKQMTDEERADFFLRHDTYWL
jgi:mannose-6-phosphate isomerase-like protein (cupin superfamily)